MGFQNLIIEKSKVGAGTANNGTWLGIIPKSSDKDLVELMLLGYLLPENMQLFKEGIEDVHDGSPSAQILLDCEGLEIIIPDTVSAICELIDEGIDLRLTNMNQDCYAAVFEAGLSDKVDKHMEIPHYDPDGYKVIGEGANGRVYRINDELIMKTFKNQETLLNILKERYLTKCAFMVGVPCPISFGLAEAEGKPALLMELVKSESLSKVIRSDDSAIETYVRPFVDLVNSIHSVKGESLDYFPRKIRYNELLKKADRLDDYMDEGYRGRIRGILENIGGEEVLLHGDLQPGNIRVSEDGLSVIDLETISTGPKILDIGAIRRSLHCDWEFCDADYSEFMKLPKDKLIRMWDCFVETYYDGMDEKEIDKNLYLAEIIGDIMSASQYLKRSQMDQLRRAVDRLQELIDMKG